jgi:hypothetical protein
MMTSVGILSCVSDVGGVIVGTLLFAIGIWSLFQKERLADTLFQFYNRPRREGAFAWLDVRIATPGREACLVIATVAGFVIAAIGLTVIVVNGA